MFVVWGSSESVGRVFLSEGEEESCKVCCSKAVWVRKERQKAWGRGFKKKGVIQIIKLMARAKGEKERKKNPNSPYKRRLCDACYIC